MSLNETGLLPELNFSPGTLVHFRRFICTTIMRVRMTQIRIRAARRDLLHDVSLLGTAWAAKGPRRSSPQCRPFFATSWPGGRNNREAGKSSTPHPPRLFL